MSTKYLNFGALVLVGVALALLGFKNVRIEKAPPLLNVSYDPTREVYKDLNAKFVTKYEEDTGDRVRVQQSHGGSTHQARAVADGQEADVVTLALPSDIEILAKRNLVAVDWSKRFPHDSQPYFSTIVFVVRKSNPLHIKDWPDLVRPNVAIITPDPRTSGNGKLSFLSAWGSVIQRGGSEDEARDFVTKLYQHAGTLGEGARNSTTTFAMEGTGDVHLTWENEALREVDESKGELEIVYPPASIRAEPCVTWVDVNVARHGSLATAKAYLNFLFTEPAQEVFAGHGYRAINADVLKKHRNHFPEITLFPVTLVAKDWSDAQEKFFGENGIYNVIHPTNAP